MTIIYWIIILLLLYTIYIYRIAWHEEKIKRRKLEETLNSIYEGYQYTRKRQGWLP